MMTQRLRSPLFSAILAALLGLVLYTATLAPDLLWGGGDFATYQTRAYLNEVIWTVNIFDHPLWVVAAHPFTKLPINNPAWRASFASAVFSSAALGMIYLSAWLLTRSSIAAWLTTAALAVSHTFWTYAVMPKVYSLNVLFLAACILLLLWWREKRQPWALYLAAFLYGLSFLNHLVMATAILGYAGFVWLALRQQSTTKRPWGALALTGLCFAAGLVPYFWLTLQAETASGIGGTYFGFLKGLLYTLTHPAALWDSSKWGIILGVYQFPLAFLAGLYGFYRLWLKDRAASLLVGFGVLGAVLFLFAAAEPGIGNIYTWNLHYYLQGYLFFALGMAPAFVELWQRSATHRSWQAALLAAVIVLPIVTYALAPGLARRMLPTVPDFRALPGRDNFAYVLSPWKQNESGARPFGENILNALPQNSVLFADYSIWAVVRYLQAVEGQRTDVTLVNLTSPTPQTEAIGAYSQQKNLFLADNNRYYDIAGIGQDFEIVPSGPVYQLLPIEP